MVSLPPLFIINKSLREIEYIKNVYKNRIQSEIDSYIFQVEQHDNVKSKDIILID